MVKVVMLGVAAIIGLNASGLCAKESAVVRTFENSYTFEKNGEISKAIDAMKWLNASTSYEVNLRLGWLTYCAKEYTVSVSYYKKAISLYPASEEARMGIILPLTALGYWDDVIVSYKEILSQCPGSSTINYKLGLIYYYRGDFANAFGHFSNVIALYPFDYSGLLMYAWSALKIGKLREAETFFNKTLMCSPHDSSAIEGLQILKEKK